MYGIYDKGISIDWSCHIGSSRAGCAVVISHESGIKTFLKWSPIINALSAPAN